LCGFTFHCW